MLAVLTVTSLDDTPDGGSLREAINTANANGEADSIEFSLSGTINLGSQLPLISHTLVIRGDNQITIDAGGVSGIFFIFNQTETIDVTLSGLTLTGGNSGSFDGGAIRNFENLTLVGSNLYGNSADDGGAIAISQGGHLTVIDSALHGNSAVRWGGAIFNSGTTVVRNSTLSGNTASLGGGIYNSPSSPGITVTDSTITDNGAAVGGGIRAVGTSVAHVTSSIVAGNTASSSGNDVQGSLATDVNNLIGGDPGLAPLADNGGPTPTHALLPGSPAIDAIALPALVRDYELNGSFADTLGVGSDLVPLGATGTFTGGVYEFGVNEGLAAQVPTANTESYSLELSFSLDQLSSSTGYQKLVDFNGPGSGAELYVFNRRLRYFIANPTSFFTGTIDLTAGQTHQVVLTRNSGPEPAFDVYVDGQFDRSFPLVSGNGVPLGIFSEPGDSGATKTARLFDVTQGGTLDRFRFFDRPLSETEVASLAPTDQRGAPYSRDIGVGRDIGAYEYQDFLVNDLGDTDDGLPDNGVTTLREAINLANAAPGHQNIYFDSALTGGTITIGSQLPTVTDEVRIAGLGADRLTIDAGNGADGVFGTGDGYRVFTFDNNAANHAIEVEISGLTLTGGDLVDGASTSSGPGGHGGGGGAILNRENLTIIATTIRGNATGRGGNGSTSGLNSGHGGRGGNGGCIHTSNGVLTLIDSTIGSNTTGRGGNGSAGITGGDGGSGGGGSGIFVDIAATLRVENSTISVNATGPG